MQNPRAEVIAVGTEILLGEITDTNSVFIARALRDAGINLFFMTSVGDNAGRIASAIQIALSRADIVITCGGLGPTVDDMTRHGVAIATERELEFHHELLEQIAARFNSFRVNMTENNKRQAYLPQGAIPVSNPVGTAPGFIVEYGDKTIISLPGVPREMKFLLVEKIMPHLRGKYAPSVIVARTLRTAGVGESLLDDLIGEKLLEQNNPTIGLAAHQGSVDVRVTAKANTQDEALAMIDEVEAQLRERIGQYIYGYDEDELESVLVDFMLAHQTRIAIIETGIPGAIIERIQAVEHGKRVVVAIYQWDHPQQLRQEIGFPDDAPLRDVAVMAAKNYCQQAGADAGIAVVLDPDVDERSDADSISAVAVYTESETSARVYGFGAKSDLAQHWVSHWALARLWQMLKSQFNSSQISS